MEKITFKKITSAVLSLFLAITFIAIVPDTAIAETSSDYVLFSIGSRDDGYIATENNRNEKCGLYFWRDMSKLIYYYSTAPNGGGTAYINYSDQENHKYEAGPYALTDGNNIIYVRHGSYSYGGSNVSKTAAFYKYNINTNTSTKLNNNKISIVPNPVEIMGLYGNNLYYTATYDVKKDRALFSLNLNSGKVTKRADNFMYAAGKGNGRYIYGYHERDTKSVIVVYDCKENKTVKTLSGYGLRVYDDYITYQSGNKEIKAKLSGAKYTNTDSNPDSKVVLDSSKTKYYLRNYRMGSSYITNYGSMYVPLCGNSIDNRLEMGNGMYFWTESDPSDNAERYYVSNTKTGEGQLIWSDTVIGTISTTRFYLSNGSYIIGVTTRDQSDQSYSTSKIIRIKLDGSSQKTLASGIKATSGKAVKPIGVYNGKLYYTVAEEGGNGTLYSISSTKSSTPKKLASDFGTMPENIVIDRNNYANTGNARYIYGSKRSGENFNVKIFDCKSGKVVKTIKSVPDEFELSFKKIGSNLYYIIKNNDGTKSLKKSGLGGGNAVVIASIPQGSSIMSISDTDVIYVNSDSYFKYSYSDDSTRVISKEEAFDAFYKSISGCEEYNLVN